MEIRKAGGRKTHVKEREAKGVVAFSLCKRSRSHDGGEGTVVLVVVAT